MQLYYINFYNMLKLQSFVLKWCCQLLRFGDYIFDMIMHMFYKHWNLVEFKFLCMKILLTLQKDLQHLITVSNITSDNRLHFCISFWLLHSMKSSVTWYFTNSKISLKIYWYSNIATRCNLIIITETVILR